MINLSDNIVEAAEQIKDYKRLSREMNDDIPDEAKLTCRQAYIQLCYRLAKFDEEFATPDDVIGQSWLNVGMTRLIHEMESRLLANGTDKGVREFFDEHFYDLELPEDGGYIDNTSNRYHLGIGHRKFYPDPLKVKVKLVINPELPSKGGTPCPINWWGSKRGQNDSGNYIWEFEERDVDTIEIDSIDERRMGFLAGNSFTSLEDGISSKFYVYREPGGSSVLVYYKSPYRNIKSNKDGRMPFTFTINNVSYVASIDIISVTSKVYDLDALTKEYFIDASSEDILPIPTEYHNDLIDYSVDAYFESMFYHQFGKYAMKQARQDADSASGAQPQGGSAANQAMQNRTLAVPPNRYRMGN